MTDALSEPDVAEVRAEFDRMLSAYREGYSWETLYQNSHERLWDMLGSGGWLGLRPSLVGPATTLALAETWGRYLLPVPFVPSLVRTDTDAEHNAGGQPFEITTFAVATAAGSWLVPFGDQPSALIPTPAGSLAELTDAAEAIDYFAPSLPISRFPAAGLTEVSQPPLNLVLPHLVAEALGAATVCFDKAVQHAKRRVAYGKPIGSFQSVKHTVADMYTGIEFARSALPWCARAASDSEARRAAATALELLQLVVESSIQVHGGMACTWEFGLHFYVRHVFALAKLAGV